jgi:uncharacterized damage-inducible protein DinB
MNDYFIWALNKARQQTLNLVTDLDNSQLSLQSVAGENHPAWTLGHLFLADCLILSLLQTPNIPSTLQLSSDWREIYAPGKAPSSDRNRYHSKEELVEKLVESNKIRCQAIEKLTITDLAKPTLEPRIAAIQPNVGHVLHYFLFHEGNHGGQLAAWRKTQGLSSASGAFGIV